MINYIRTAKVLLIIYFIINLLCTALIVTSIYIRDQCNPGRDMLFVNVIDLVLYGIATVILLFFYKVEIQKSESSQIIDDNFLTMLNILFFTYIFWHTVVFFIIFIFFTPECYYKFWFFMRLGCDMLLIIYSIICMIICVFIKKGLREYIRNKLEIMSNQSLYNI